MRICVLFALCTFALAAIVSPCSAYWKRHTVEQANGSGTRIKLPANIQILTEEMNDITGVPYIIYVPEKNQVLMTFAWGYPHMAGLMSSLDGGNTWSKPRYMRADDQGNPTLGFQTGLTYLGNGRIITGTGYMSEDYGETWPVHRPVRSCWEGKPFYGWDPIMIDRDPNTNAITRFILADYRQVDPAKEYSSHASVFLSEDEGKTWSEPVTPPEWKGVNEVAFVRAKNGDIIAACRTDISQPYLDKGISLDHFCGLAISISKDNGKSWSPLNRLYDWGRHHPCMVVMSNGDIVLTYVVRLGYNRAADGYPQFGVEAVVSKDNGRTWDLDHKYILSSWKGNRKGGPNEWWASSQATSTVVLPDGSLLTAFGTGYRSQPRASDGMPSPRDVGIVKWQLNETGLVKTRSISTSPWNSDKRNKFELTPAAKPGKGEGRVNLVSEMQGAKATCSGTNEDASAIMPSDYFPPTTLMLSTVPAWIEVQWNKPRTIDEVVIHAGEPTQRIRPSGECAPVEYQVQYEKLGLWIDAVRPVKQVIDDRSPRDNEGGLVFTHKFPKVETAAIRILINKTNDTGKRVSSPDKVIVTPDKLSTTIRGIEVYGE